MPRARYVCALAVGFALAHLVVAIAYPGSLRVAGSSTPASLRRAVVPVACSVVAKRPRRMAVHPCRPIVPSVRRPLLQVVLADAANVSQPSVADMGYLAFYPLAACAIVLLLRARLPSLTRALVLDASVGALAVLAIVAALVSRVC